MITIIWDNLAAQRITTNTRTTATIVQVVTTHAIMIVCSGILFRRQKGQMLFPLKQAIFQPHWRSNSNSGSVPFPPVHKTFAPTLFEAE